MKSQWSEGQQPGQHLASFAKEHPEAIVLPVKCAASTKLYGRPLFGKSRITNGKELLPSVDGRSIWARRFRDLISLHASDLGGTDCLSQAELSLIRRAAALTVELEHMEERCSS